MKKYFFPAIVVFLLFGYFVGKPLYMQPSYQRGEVAPAITGSTLNGDFFSLTDLKGKYVLIDFWGSWCGPCRRENPKLADFYKKFKIPKDSNGTEFEVVSIGIETNADRWKRAIIKDELIWPYHILDQAQSLRFFDSPIAKTYGVKEVPTKFFLNPAGEIIGVNLPFAQMEEILTGQNGKN